MDRDAAYALLCEHTKGDSLRKHGLAVEAAMRRFAVRFDGNEEEWAVTGLLHDFDYERDPEGHPQNGKPILEQAGVPGTIVHAIQSHGDHFARCTFACGASTPSAWSITLAGGFLGELSFTISLPPSSTSSAARTAAPPA